MTYLCHRAAANAARVRNAHCYFIVNNNDARPRARPPRGAESRALEPRSVRLGRTKNVFGGRALTDTEAAFSLARNGQASQPSPASLPHASCVAPDHAPFRNKHQSTPDETCIV